MATWFQKTFQLKARKKGCYLITDQVLQAIGADIKKIQIGLMNIFLHHTSAGLSLGQNYDPAVREDLSNAFDRIAPQGNFYKHDDQGPDDMPAHIKSTISGVSLNIPISKGKLVLGTWQGIYLMEYRSSQQTRTITTTIQGQIGK